MNRKRFRGAGVRPSDHVTDGHLIDNVNAGHHVVKADLEFNTFVTVSVLQTY